MANLWAISKNENKAISRTQTHKGEAAKRLLKRHFSPVTGCDDTSWGAPKLRVI